MAVQPAIFPELEGPDFVRSSDVEAVGEKVLELHGGVGSRLHEVAELVDGSELRILWLLNEKPWNDESEDDQEPEIAGRCVKAPKLWHDVTGVDYAIWVRKHFWDEFNAELRRAVLLHELLHIEIRHDKDGRPKFAVRKHDVEDFIEVARQYGPSALAGYGGQYVRAAAAFAGEPAPIATAKPTKAARDVVQPLQDVANETGHSIAFAYDGQSATIEPETPLASSGPPAPACGFEIPGGFPCTKPAGHVEAGDDVHDDIPF